MTKDPREPATVRIGPFDYEIRWMDRIEASDSSAFGLHNGNDHCIRLERSRRRQRVASTFLHEVIHAINQVFGTERDKRGRVNEEQCTAGLAFGMCAFHRDNPDATEWWSRLLLVDPMKEYE